MTEKRFFKGIIDSTVTQYKHNGIAYVPYVDSQGNTLTMDDILFTNEEGYRKICGVKKTSNKQDVEIFAADTVDHKSDEGKQLLYTVNSPGIKMIFGNAGHFPVGLETDDGKSLDIKISAKTKEVLPIHAGACEQLNIIYTGAPNSGKTVHCLQLSYPDLHDAMARETSFSICDDVPIHSRSRMRYEEAARRLKIEHILPPVTFRGADITPYEYYVTYIDDSGVKNNAIVGICDISGEECLHMTEDTRIFNYKTMYFIISADELIAARNGGYADYSKVMDNLFRQIGKFKHMEVKLIISKADLLFKGENGIEDMNENNSIQLTANGAIRLKTHANGFDQAVYDKRQADAREIIREICPNLYNRLSAYIPPERLTFAMISSLGTEAKGRSDNDDKKYDIDEYDPYCIEEPFLATLSRYGCYPMLNDGRESGAHARGESVDGLKIPNMRKLRKILKNVIDN